MALAELLEFARARGVVRPGRQTDEQVAAIMGIPPTPENGIGVPEAEAELPGTRELIEEARALLSDLLVDGALTEPDARRAREWLERLWRVRP